MTKPLTTINM
jgi:beta-lactamase class D